MRKKFVITTIISIFLATLAVSAQSTNPNFAGDWELDASKSVLPEASSIQSMTMKIAQTDKELKFETTTKRNVNGARGGIGGGMQTYNLEGKEMNADITGRGTVTGKEVRRAAFTSDGKLSLTLTRNINSDTGNVVLKTNDTWELLDNGKTLKVIRYSESPRGATNAELYFTKKSSGALTVKGAGDTANLSSGNAIAEPKKISGGILNGKAISLPKPVYPAEARGARAGGAVNVQVTIDEQGNVISANAVSGHELLRPAAEEAARNSKFTPTLLQGVPVMVTGVIVYNFVP